MTSEKTIQNECIRYLATRRDIRGWRQNVGKAVPIGVVKKAIKLMSIGKVKEGIQMLSYGVIAYGTVGMADWAGIVMGGKRLEIEFKDTDSVQSPEQKNYQAMIERFGGIYILAKSVEDVEERLDD